MPRVGVEHLRAVLIDDSEGIVEQLDPGMKRSTDACRDPWAEGREPAAPGQFRPSLPLTVLPQVPVR